MASATLLAAPFLSVVKFVSRKDLIEIHASSRQVSPSCPLCDSPSRRVQSRYVRTLADLPWQGVAVRILLRVRRFFCDSSDCPRQIFAERLLGVAKAFARRTSRLADAIELIGFALGGEAGARTAVKLGIQTSPDTLIRAVRRAVLPPILTPRVLGVDDWSIRRGHSYATVLVDLERHCRVDVLPDRKAETLAAWLKQHPGIEVISRDRADAYAQGARVGAPDAVQVVDRWHLLKNLGDALERFLATKHEALAAVGKALTQEARSAATAQMDRVIGSQESTPSPGDSGQTSVDRLRQARRSRRLAYYERVIEMFKTGQSQRAIAQALQLDIKTVRKYEQAGSFPERAQRRCKQPGLQAYKPYLEERWAKGCRNATQLCSEIQQQGYGGSVVTVRRLIHIWRNGDGRGHWNSVAVEGSKPLVKVRAPSPRRAMWLLVKEPESLEAEERAMYDKLLALCPEAVAAKEIACQFQVIIRERKVEELGAWLATSKASGIASLASFAVGIESDRQCVEAALRLEWSNGQVEGQVNRIKTVKRSMFGRASFDLLRRRILRAA